MLDSMTGCTSQGLVDGEVRSKGDYNFNKPCALTEGDARALDERERADDKPYHANVLNLTEERIILLSTAKTKQIHISNLNDNK